MDREAIMDTLIVEVCPHPSLPIRVIKEADAIV